MCMNEGRTVPEAKVTSGQIRRKNSNKSCTMHTALTTPRLSYGPAGNTQHTEITARRQLQRRRPPCGRQPSGHTSMQT